MQIDDIIAKYRKVPQFSDLPFTDVNQRGFDEDTILHLASRWGNVNDVVELIAAGAEVNAVGDIGNTPLHEAANQLYVEVVNVLVNAGADTTIKNEFGQTPLDLAELKMSKFREMLLS